MSGQLVVYRANKPCERLTQSEPYPRVRLITTLSRTGWRSQLLPPRQKLKRGRSITDGTATELTGRIAYENGKFTRETNLIITSATQTLTLTPLRVLQVADFLAEHRWRLTRVSHDMDKRTWYPWWYGRAGAFYQQRRTPHQERTRSRSANSRSRATYRSISTNMANDFKIWQQRFKAMQINLIEVERQLKHAR